MLSPFFFSSRHSNQPISPLTKCFIDSTDSKGPVLGNHLGIQELPKDCHTPIDLSPIISNRHKEITPLKNKSKFFTIFI